MSQSVTEKRVSCDGGGGALGHPVVWYTVRPGKTVRCQYCSASLSGDGDFGTRAERSSPPGAP